MRVGRIHGVKARVHGVNSVIRKDVVETQEEEEGEEEEAEEEDDSWGDADLRRLRGRGANERRVRKKNQHL